MKRRLLVLSFAACSLLGVTLVSNAKAHNAFAEELMDVDSIQALSHKDGATVDFINNDMIEMWKTDVQDFDKMKEIYEFNTDIRDFANVLGDKDSIRSLYATYDDFKPVNNTLTWKTKVNANTFDIVVSLNDELTQVVYSETGLKEMKYTMENPLANQHYYWQVTANTKNGERVKSRVFDFVSGNNTRTIDVGGVSNTRDIGGVKTKYGTFKQGLVYRGARLDDVDSRGLETLKQLDIQTDLDIRNDGEGAKNPANLNKYYLRTLQNYFHALSPANRKSTIDCLRTFTDESNYPIYYHCAVGRDRTGTLTMTLLGLFGASEDYIFHEYYNSLFSVTGAYQKELNDLNYGTFSQTIDTFKNYPGSSLAEKIENYLAPKEDETTHEMVGLTSEEIKKIRDIFAGNIEVEHGLKTTVAEENYAGKCFITFKSLGHKDVVKLISKNSTVTAPYALQDDMDWYVNGEKWDESKIIEESAVIYADYKAEYVVTLHFIGIDRSDEYKHLIKDAEIRFEEYQKEGYTLLVLSDSGKEISKLKVERDTVINLIYTK